LSYLDVCGTRNGHVETRTQPEGDRSLIAVKQTGYGAQNIWMEKETDNRKSREIYGKR
jgi:hypothetical protein